MNLLIDLSSNLFFLAPKASDQSTMMNQLASLQLMKTGMLSHASHLVYLWTTDFKSSELLSFLMDMLGYFRDEVEVPVDRILTGKVKTLFRLILTENPFFLNHFTGWTIGNVSLQGSLHITSNTLLLAVMRAILYFLLVYSYFCSV